MMTPSWTGCASIRRGASRPNRRPVDAPYLACRRPTTLYILFVRNACPWSRRSAVHVAAQSGSRCLHPLFLAIARESTDSAVSAANASTRLIEATGDSTRLALHHSARDRRESAVSWLAGACAPICSDTPAWIVARPTRWPSSSTTSGAAGQPTSQRSSRTASTGRRLRPKLRNARCAARTATDGARLDGRIPSARGTGVIACASA